MKREGGHWSIVFVNTTNDKRCMTLKPEFRNVEKSVLIDVSGLQELFKFFPGLEEEKIIIILSICGIQFSNRICSFIMTVVRGVDWGKR